jgi:hypothetical protein
MKNLKSFFFLIAIVFGIMIQSCSKDSNNNASSEDLTITIIGNYSCQLTEAGYLTATDIPAIITKVDNATIQIAVTGKETVLAKVSKLTNAFLIDVKDQIGISGGGGGDFINNEINFGFNKTTNGTTVKLNYYGTKTL